ncbi:MAG TPA: acyl-CoA reductase [Membranihabitans sp.]|nr:acyl-CoA reductase [Membranihabitans sp.]
MIDVTTFLKSLGHLRLAIQERHPLLEANIHRTYFHNPWFEKSKYWQSLDSLAVHMLFPSAIEKWCTNYRFPVKTVFSQTVGLIFAGNIPLVGFHDFLSVYLSGHRVEVKLSGKDPYVFPAVIQLIAEIDPTVNDRIKIVEKLQNFDAVIATGSNNTNRYFRKYFADYPSILRNNRTSVAILVGNETRDQLTALSHDIFDYFGLGCRNVTKLFVPEGYDFQPLLEAMESFSGVMNNIKYKNNFDYNLSIELLNRSEIISTDFVLLKKDTDSFFSPVGMVYFDTYSDLVELDRLLSNRREELQIVVGQHTVPAVPHTDFGMTQQPGLFDYPDGEDIGHFLFQLTCNVES